MDWGGKARFITVRRKAKGEAMELLIDHDRLIYLYLGSPARNWTERLIADFLGRCDRFIDVDWFHSFFRNLRIFAPDIAAVRSSLLELLYSNGTRPPALAANYLLTEHLVYNRHTLRFDPQTREFFALYWPQTTLAPEIELIYRETPAERLETLETSVINDTALVAILRHQIDINQQARRVFRHARHARVKEITPNDLRLRLLDAVSGRKVTLAIKKEAPIQSLYWPSLSSEDFVN